MTGDVIETAPVQGVGNGSRVVGIAQGYFAENLGDA